MLAQPSVRVLRRVPTWFTTRPETVREKLVNSAVVWLVLMAFWTLCDVLLTLYPPGPGGRQMAPEGWTSLAVYGVAGLIAIWCAGQTRIPAGWDARIPAARRLLLPAVVGVGFGLAAVLIEEITRSLHIMEAIFGPANVAFPGSVLVSGGGAIKWELFFLIFPVSLLLWLISRVALRGRGESRTFWSLAAVFAAFEVAMQGIPLMVMSNGAIGPAAFAAYAVHSYAFNFAAAVGFRRYGLLAPVLVRLGNYMVWHVLYGNFFFGS